MDPEAPIEAARAGNRLFERAGMHRINKTRFGRVGTCFVRALIAVVGESQALKPDRCSSSRK
jgi:hypothetical protein